MRDLTPAFTVAFAFSLLSRGLDWGGVASDLPAGEIALSCAHAGDVVTAAKANTIMATKRRAGMTRAATS